MSWVQVLDAASCALIFFGCVNVTFLARGRRCGHRFWAYELHRIGYAILGGGAAAMLLGMLPIADATILDYRPASWQGVMVRAGIAIIFAGRAVRTIFGGVGCLKKR